MKLSVKNVKVHEDMSEETLCFSADLYDNGKLVAHVENTGKGGSNRLWSPKGGTYNDVAKYDNLDTECEIFELVEEYNYVTKNQSKMFILFNKLDGKMYKSKFPMPIGRIKKTSPIWLVNQKKRYDAMGYTILNRNL